ncbi:hypothetical protein GCM10009534_65600 [Kribbella sandramycini]
MLRALKVWAGAPSYEVITQRINQAWRAAGRPASELARRTTVADCFRSGRRRLNTELTLAIVGAMHDDPAYVAHWRQVFRVISGETQAAAQVQVLGELPEQLAEFTGRTAEWEQLRDAVESGRRSGSPVVITAIEGMAGLQGSTHLAVDVFRPDEARAFLIQALGDIPAGTDPRAADRIAARCGFLPLALGLVAGAIRASSGWTLTDHAERLDERCRADRLDSGVELALDVSYQQLPADRQRLLRLLAQHPGEDFDACAAAAMCGTDLEPTETAVRQLHGDHMLELTAPGLYTFHDLVRAYAGIRATEEERPTDRRTALARLLDHYLAVAAAAMDTLHPAEAENRPRIGPPVGPSPSVHDSAAARSWLDTERLNLVAAATHAADHGWPGHTHAYDAAVQSGELDQQALALTSLGATHSQLGMYKSAAEHLQHALRLYYRDGNSAGQAHALHNLGIANVRLGRYKAAVGHHQRALVLYRQTGDCSDEATTLDNLGEISHQLGELDAAAKLYREALAICCETGEQAGEASVLNGLAATERAAGRTTSAIDQHSAANLIAVTIGDPYQQARAQAGLGAAHRALGLSARAHQHYQRAIALYTQLGQPEAELLRIELSDPAATGQRGQITQVE